MMPTTTTIRVAGRVNVIGEHTDYTGGLALPMAIELGTTITVERTGDVVRLRSDKAPGEALVPLDIADPAAVTPDWARYVAGVVAELRPTRGAVGRITSDLPVGAGLSSSAALELAVAVALGFTGTAQDLARLGQRAEHRASGVPCGILDQLAIAAGARGLLSRIDCTSLEVRPVPLPEDLVILAVDSGQRRTLVGSEYAQRRAECLAAEAVVGPLCDALVTDLDQIGDRVIRRRARHVVTENARVDEFIAALGRADYVAAGRLIGESNASLRDDFEVTTPQTDALAERLSTLPGSYGARLTGGGFGGTVIALCARDIDLPADLEAWRLRPADGIRLMSGTQ
jgi:galactokinase